MSPFLKMINITYGEDTSITPTSGNWNVNCSDNCSWTTAQDVLANMTLYGTGQTTFISNLTFTNPNQYIFINLGCNFTIESRREIK